MIDWIRVGDCRELLPTLEPKSVDAVITNPPHWGTLGDHNNHAIGLEEDPLRYCANLLGVFDVMRPALKERAPLWLVLGDSTWAGTVGLPWRVAFEMQGRGWFLGQVVTWHQPAHPTRRTFAFLFYPSALQTFPLCPTAMISADVPDPLPGYYAGLPGDLLAALIDSTTHRDDLILDPFAGLGGTGEVAITSGRRFVGFELDPKAATAGNETIQGWIDAKERNAR